MRARYLGDHNNFTSWGIRFPRGVFVPVTDAHAQKKISGNREFEVENSDAEEVVFRDVIETTAPVVLSTESVAALTSEQVAVIVVEDVPAASFTHIKGKPGPKPKQR